MVGKFSAAVRNTLIVETYGQMRVTEDIPDLSHKMKISAAQRTYEAQQEA
jgi:hypothetical protein